MIKPKSPLPWEIIEENETYVYALNTNNKPIISSPEDTNHIKSTITNEEVLGTSEWLRLEDQDAKYIVYAANTLPKAIKYIQSLLAVKSDNKSEEEIFKILETI